MNAARRWLLCAALVAIVPFPARAQTAASNTATIAGHVTDSRSKPVDDYTVIVFSTDRTTWTANPRSTRIVAPATDGGFEVMGLPPGEYWVVAIDAAPGNQIEGELQKADVLEALSARATRVMLAERERYLTVLRIIRR
jgi:hypothetical protein